MEIDLLIDLPDEDLALVKAAATLRGTTAEELLRKASMEGAGGTCVPIVQPDKSVMRPLVHLNLFQS